jgi:hypothetical protein
MRRRKERRFFPRRPTSFRVDYARGPEVDEIGYASWGVARNLSMGGMFIEHTSNLKMGETIITAFVLPGTGDPYRLKARVVRKTREGAGLEFMDVGQAGLRKTWRLWSYCAPASLSGA